MVAYPNHLRGEARSVVTGKGLTTQDILDIRMDTRVQTVIGREYGISGAMVSHIKTGRRWAHIPFEVS